MFQYNNTFLVKDITDIPANKLNLLSQVIAFVPKEVEELRLEYNNTEISVLTEILCDYIYLFEGSTNDISLSYKDSEVDEDTLEKMYENNDQQGLIKNSVNGVYFDSSNFSDIYLNIKNKLHKMTRSGRHNNVEVLDENSYYVDITDKLYEGIFGKDESNHLSISSSGESRTYGENNYSMQYLYVKLNKNTVIAFVLEHRLNTNLLKWNYNKYIFFMNRDKTVVKVNWDFEEIFNLIKGNFHIWDFHLKNFANYLDLFNYDTEEYIKDPWRLSEFSGLFSWSTDVKKFFEPLYVNNDIGLKVYLNFTRKSSYYMIICTLYGKLISREEINNMENNQGILDAIRIAENIKEFIHLDKTGISPYDGDFYIKGEKVKNTKEGVVYQNDLGFIFNCNKINQTMFRGEYSFYVKDGFFVKAKKEEQKELSDALALMNELTKWA